MDPRNTIHSNHYSVCFGSENTCEGDADGPSDDTSTPWMQEPGRDD